MGMKRRGSGWPAMWGSVLLYGALLAVGTLLLQLLDYSHFARSRSGETYAFLIGGGFLALGIWIGARVIGQRAGPRPKGNPQALAALGISEREFAVLRELAAGLSNKEIARRLEVSPNTIKTHIARLFEKLGASRRTEAIAKARELDILP